ETVSVQDHIVGIAACGKTVRLTADGDAFNPDMAAGNVNARECYLPVAVSFPHYVMADCPGFRERDSSAVIAGVEQQRVARLGSRLSRDDSLERIPRRAVAAAHAGHDVVSVPAGWRQGQRASRNGQSALSGAAVGIRQRQGNLIRGRWR